MANQLPNIEGDLGRFHESRPVTIATGDRAQAATDSAIAYAPVTKADTDLPGGAARALLVGAAGTANLMQADGTIRTDVPLQAGYNPICALQVRTGGTADGIWALY